jgi:hypothetical protein
VNVSIASPKRREFVKALPRLTRAAVKSGSSAILLRQLERLDILPFHGQRLAEVAYGVGELRVEPDRFAKVLDRVVDAICVGQRAAHVVMSDRRLRTNGERRLVVAYVGSAPSACILCPSATRS